MFESQYGYLLDVLIAVSTVVAAFFAAVSARAAKDAVEEAKLARAELAPKLILEKDFLDFHFVWPHPDSLNGEAVFLARKHWKDHSPTPPNLHTSKLWTKPSARSDHNF